MLHTHKMYIIKTAQGGIHRVQRSWSSQDVGPATYKTLGGAERVAGTMGGGVFTIYLQTKNERKPDRIAHLDEQIHDQARRLGFVV